MTQRRDFWVGILFIGAIAGVGYMTVMIKGWSALVAPDLPPLKVEFPQVDGLQKGEEVRVRGVQIGQVSDIRYKPRDNVLVKITLFKDPELHRDCAFQIRSKSPLGGKYVEIDPGSPGEPLAEKVTFAGRPPRNLYSELGKLLGENRNAITKTVRNLSDATEAVTKGKGTLGALIFDRQMKEQLQNMVGEVHSAVTGKRKGLLYAVLSDEELAARLSGMVSDLSGALKQKDTPLGVVLYSKKAGKDVRKVIADASQITGRLKSGKGTLGKLVTDDTLYTEAAGAASSLRNITKGKGLAAYLINDPESKKKGEEILTGVRDTVVGMSKGKGTLGKLLVDDRLHKSVQKLIQQLRRSVEDSREHAPVNQLVNMLGAVF